MSAIAIHVVVYMGNFGGCTRLLKLREGAFGGGDAFLILCFYRFRTEKMVQPGKGEKIVLSQIIIVVQYCTR